VFANFGGIESFYDNKKTYKMTDTQCIICILISVYLVNKLLTYSLIVFVAVAGRRDRGAEVDAGSFPAEERDDVIG